MKTARRGGHRPAGVLGGDRGPAPPAGAPRGWPGAVADQHVAAGFVGGRGSGLPSSGAPAVWGPGRAPPGAAVATLISGAPTGTVVPGSRVQRGHPAGERDRHLDGGLGRLDLDDDLVDGHLVADRTCQAMTSASFRPSPRSGSRKSGTVVPLQPGDRVEDPVDAGQVVVFEHRRRVGDVEAGDPQDRRLQVVEALLGQARGDLGPVPAETRRLVDDDGPPGARAPSRPPSRRRTATGCADRRPRRPSPRRPPPPRRPPARYRPWRRRRSA